MNFYGIFFLRFIYLIFQVFITYYFKFENNVVYVIWILQLLQVSEVPPRANKKYITSPPPPVTLPATALEGAFGAAAGASSSIASSSSMKPSLHHDLNLIESNAAAHVVHAYAKEKSNQVFQFDGKNAEIDSTISQNKIVKSFYENFLWNWLHENQEI